MNILAKNFINILRNGAFDENRPIGLLSAYKWGQLTQLADHHNVMATYANGIEKYYYDDNMNIPRAEIDKIKNLLEAQPHYHFSNFYDFNKIHLNNKGCDRQLNEIRQKEYADEEKSYPTMNLLAIIIQNINHLLTGNSYLRGILDMGIFLRNEGDKVDFVKLENWLQQTRATRLAALQASMLVRAFGFSAEEIPFVTNIDEKSLDILIHDLRHRETQNLKTWEYHQTHNGFTSGPKTAMRTIGHTLSLMKYAPGEAMSSIGRGVLKGLSEIEE